MEEILIADSEIMKKMQNQTFNRIKVVLAEKGLKSKYLVEKLGVNVTTVSRWCTNAMQPRLDTLYLIADALSVDVRELLVSTKDRN